MSLSDTLASAARKRAPDMPEHVARTKGHNTAVGIVLFGFGVLGFVAGMGLLVFPFVWLHEAPSAWFIAFAALALTFGFILALLGARALSDDVIEANDAPTIITAIGRAIGLARGKVTNGGA